MTYHAWAGVAALCLALAACDHSGESAASTPSADSFRAEVFEVRIGETTEKVNGASVTSAFFREAKVLPMVGRLFLAGCGKTPIPRQIRNPHYAELKIHVS